MAFSAPSTVFFTIAVINVADAGDSRGALFVQFLCSLFESLQFLLNSVGFCIISPVNIQTQNMETMDSKTLSTYRSTQLTWWCATIQCTGTFTHSDLLGEYHKFRPWEKSILSIALFQQCYHKMKLHHQHFLIQRQCALSTMPAAKKWVLAHYKTVASHHTRV